MKSPKKIKNEYKVLSLTFLIFLIVLGIFLYSKKQLKDNEESTNKNSQQQIETTPTPAKRPLPTGKQVYNYSHGSDVTGPKPSKLTVDPINPSMGGTLTFSADIDHPTPITKVTAVLITDNQKVENNLTLASGDDKNGTWTTDWIVEDTYNSTYQIDLYTHSQEDSFVGGLTFR